MEFLCKVFDRSIIENASEYHSYLVNPYLKNDKKFYKQYTINNIKLDDFDKMLNDYITNHNKKINVYFIHCEFKIEFDNNFITQNIETDYAYIMERKRIKSQLIHCIDCMKFKGYNFHNITQITINTISHKCNATYEHYMRYPMHMVERRMKFIIAKNPSLINSFDRNKNHPLVRKSSHIPFNN